ncbi:MAG: YraN family protein [Eubacterium sp.]|nr:YraN family protein [Eubacterium sp.]
MPRNTRKLGTEYEQLAAAYLEEEGMHILEHSFRCRFGEIDLVADDLGTLVFVEVKYRIGVGAGSPEDSVTYRKQRTISKVSDYYRLKKQIPDDVPCRYDVVAIDGNEIRHIRDAFWYTI